MNCPKCNLTMRMGKSHISFEGDDDPTVETKAFCNQTMLCLNPSCTNYAGTDLDNPKFIVETLKNPLN